MSLRAPPRRFDVNDLELIDRPGLDTALLREELSLLERTNRRLGGHQLVLAYVERLLPVPPPARLTVLDLGTGSADIPRALVEWARRRRLDVSIVAVDRNTDVLRIAEESCRGWPEIRLEEHDLRALPYGPGSFDLVLCSLALHHIDTADVVTVLRQMQALARTGYLVNDLRRNWPAIWTTELLARTLTRSPFLRHDAPQSCRAAFTVDELQAMAREAGLADFKIRRHHGMFRMVLEGRK